MTIKASSKQFQQCVNYWTKHTFQTQFLQFFTPHYGLAYLKTTANRGSQQYRHDTVNWINHTAKSYQLILQRTSNCINRILFSRLQLFTWLRCSQPFTEPKASYSQQPTFGSRQTQYTSLASSTSILSSHQCNLLPSSFDIEILYVFIICSKFLCEYNFVSFLNICYLHN
jgi:hypothetical protein